MRYAVRAAQLPQTTKMSSLARYLALPLLGFMTLPRG